jgi:hypothetical protein
MAIPDAAHLVDRELREIFGPRLQSLIVYGGPSGEHAKPGAHGHAETPTRTMAVVERMTREDLHACAGRVAAWHAHGLATPLLVAAHEFDRSLDAFPLEFGAILADHVVVSGANPFAASRLDPADVRRACEVQARSHLLHLREGYLETRGRADALSLLILQSAPAFAALVSSIARLEGRADGNPAAAARHVERVVGDAGADAAPQQGAISRVVELAGAHDLASADAEQLLPPYLDAIERIVSYVDGWSARR